MKLLEFQLEHKELLNKLILGYQEDFPLVSRPYQKIAEELNVSEAEVLDGFQLLNELNILSRLGPIFTTHRVGYSFLAAVKCPETRVDEVASIINSHEEVNHNYLRENDLNLWFVCTGKNKEHLNKFVSLLEEEIQLKVFKFPMKKAFKIDLKAKHDICWDDVL